MFVILTYDINKKRVNKILKICKRYLIHIQNSVFEGNITNSKLGELKNKIDRIIIKEIDRVCIYKFDSIKYAKKEQIGYVQEFSNQI